MLKEVKFIRYEYEIDDGIRVFTGSFTLREDADKSNVGLLNAHEVERFTALVKE